MSVSCETITEHTYRANLGIVQYCEETGSVRITVREVTHVPESLREFAGLLNDAANMMEAGGWT